MDDRDCYEEPIIIVNVHGDGGSYHRKSFYCHSAANEYAEAQEELGNYTEIVIGM